MLKGVQAEVEVQLEVTRKNGGVVDFGYEMSIAHILKTANTK